MKRLLLFTCLPILLIGISCGDDAPGAPGAIAGFSVSQGYLSNEIALSWNGAAGATNYAVERALFGEAPFAMVGASTNTNFTDTDTLVGETWHYRVRAVGEGGAGPWSAAVAGYCSGLRVVTIATSDCLNEQYNKLVSLAIDSLGRPVIGFWDSATRTPYCAEPAGRAWRIATVDPAQGGGLTQSLAIDAQGRVHLAYHNDTQNDVRYARREGTNWTIEIVETNNYYAPLSLALDGQGNPRIAYTRDNGGYSLRYASRDGSGWTSRDVDTNAEAGLDPSLALDTSGLPHITYYKNMPDTNDIFYSRDTGSGWIRESLTTNGGPNRFSSLVLDAQDHPRVSFIGWNSADVQYGAYDGSDWTFETVAAGQGWSFTGLAFDAAGAPMVAYYKYLSEAGLYIARKQGGVWSRLLLDAGADCGLHLSFALDGYGRAHIAYFDKTRKQIRYLCWLE